MPAQFRKALRAFLLGEPARSGNYSTNGETLFYVCSPLLLRAPDGTISFCLCGRPSLTAKRCVNTFFEAIGRTDKLITKKGQLHWNDRPITSTDRYQI